MERDLTLEEMLEKAEEKIEQMDESSAIELYESILEDEPENLEALWNLSILYAKEGFRYDDESEMISYYEKAKELADTALENYPDEANAHFAYAVVIGRISDISSPRERIRAADDIRHHVEKAIKLDPDHKFAWHVLGVWHMNAANLSRAERWAANLLLGGAPEGASNSEAEEALKRAIELDETNILFQLDLAKFYKLTDRENEAKEVLERLVELEPKYQDDPDYIEEGRVLLQEIS